MEGGKALRHQVFMYMDLQVLIGCSYFPPSGSKQNTLTCLSVGLFHIVMLYLLLCSSHVAGMIGLINKTKGLRFCNDSGFLELYNDPQVRLTL